MARLTILTQQEIDSLYAIPILDDEERLFLFSLDNEDRAVLDTLGNDTARKVDYILQLGYYRAVGYLFLFSSQKVKSDVEFIMRQYFPGEPFPKKQLSKSHHYQNRCAVMNQFGLKDADASFQAQLLKEAKALAKRHSLSWKNFCPIAYCRTCSGLRTQPSRALFPPRFAVWSTSSTPMPTKTFVGNWTGC